jgi:hypothetical protein
LLVAAYRSKCCWGAIVAGGLGCLPRPKCVRSQQMNLMIHTLLMHVPKPVVVEIPKLYSHELLSQVTGLGRENLH